MVLLARLGHTLSLRKDTGPPSGYALQFASNPSWMTVRLVHVHIRRIGVGKLVYHDKGVTLRDCVSQISQPQPRPRMRPDWNG